MARTKVEGGGFGFKFGYEHDDTAEWVYKGIHDTNETSTRNLKLQLAAQQQSEMRWMNFQDEQNDKFFAQVQDLMHPGGGPLEQLAQLLQV
ncbi:MAG: hypothetical protein KF760_08100 [Candidatus Eremiobacteraeota bacterium]|nr:hypothetical protein [Candidatus Eremiobacteraeota bacterium]MCW5867970.1 hypothetical protein [Candidatus Eremiobacteraeota bacterium]